MKGKYQTHFCFLLFLSLYQFNMKKIFKDFRRLYLGLYLGEAQIHMMTHTKWEPRGRPQEPFFVQKNHIRNYQKRLNF